MSRNKTKRFLSILLILCMVLAMIPATAISAFAEAEESAPLTLGEGFVDMPENWSTAALVKAVKNGLLSGYQDGAEKLIKASNPLTRAEMAAVVNRAFASTKEADISKVSDMSATDWYAKDMAKAVKMGTFAYDTKLRPNDKISRQEAFTVLARAFKLVGEDSNHKALNVFSDKGEIASWALDSLDGMAAAGYVQGSGGRLNPKADISRAEFAVVMDNLVKEYIDSGDAVTKVTATGNVLVRKAGTTLKNVTIKGDLIIADGVGEGDVTLDGVKVEGRTVVRGGGVNSIIIKGNSDLGKVVVAKIDGKVRVSVESGAKVEVIYVDDGSDDVFVEGEIGTLEVAGDGITVTATNATISKGIVSGDNSRIIVNEGSKVKDGVISGKSSAIVVNTGASVEKVTVTGSGASVEGKGQVKEVAVKEGGDGAGISSPNTKISVENDVEDVKAGGVAVPGGSTVTTNAEGTGITVTQPDIGGGGGGGGSISNPVEVKAVTVKGTGDATSITTYKGTLQMKADVQPSNAGNKKVTWSVDNEAIATIDSKGLLTAVTNGKVTVIATANDESGVSGTAEIEISNQNITKVPTPIITLSKSSASNREAGVTFTAEQGAGVSDANLYYTTDGDNPNTGSEKYTGLVTLEAPKKDEESTITIKLFGTRDGLTDSDVAIATVTYLEIGANTYTVIFKDWDGAVLDTQTIKHGADATAPTPERTGYSLSGWDKAFTNVTSDLTVTAQYTINQYTITFNSAGGSAVPPITQNFGTAVTAPDGPTKEGHIFIGWNPEVPTTMPAQNVEVTAQWEAEILGTINPIVAAGDEKVILTAMNETGFTFYYKTTPTTDEANKPAMNSVDLTDWTEFATDTEIPASNDVEIFVQTIKVAGGKIKAWGEASATPEENITEVGFASLTANGTSGETTTSTLYIRFNKEISSLNLDNFTVEGATATLLTMSSTDIECSISIKDITVKNGEKVKVTINKKGYLFTPATREVAVYVENIQASINPMSAIFNKTNPEDIKTTISFGTATKIESIKKGDIKLIEGIEYTVSDNTLTIKKEYLATQPKGSTALTIAFDQGNTRDLTISITNEAEYNITVAEITGGFGGETAAAYNQFNAVINTAKEGERVTITITDLTDTYDAWKVKSATIKDADGGITDIAGTPSNKRVHDFSMPASDVTAFIELEPEADSNPPTISDNTITANAVTDISLYLQWNKATDIKDEKPDKTPDGFLRYYVYRSSNDNISTAEAAEENGELLNKDGTYNIAGYNLTDLDPETTYYFNVVVADYAGNKTAYTTKEVKTLAAVTDLDLTSKVIRPVKYATFDREFKDSDQYTGTDIAWYKMEGDNETIVYGSGNFEAGTVYVAKVTLTAKDGYSFSNATAFTYTDAASVSFEKVADNDATKGNVTITFPATEAVTQYTLTLDGGGLTSDPSGSQIAENTKVTVTVSPNADEKIVSFTVNGVEEIEKLAGNRYTFTIIKDTTIKVTYSGKFALISSGENVDIEFKVGGSTVTTAKKGDTVTMIVTPKIERQELVGAVVSGISKDEISEEIPGGQFAFTMPGEDVDAKITVGLPNKKLSYNPGISGGGQITLINGKCKDYNSNYIEGLYWSYFTNTLTMDGFTGKYLGRISGQSFPFDLELKGTNNINSSYMAALDFSGTVTIKGNGALNISNIYAYDYIVEGIGLGSLLDRINFKDKASIHVTVENTKKQNGVAISKVMPFIGNEKAAYKGIANWGGNDGNTPESPIEISYRVSKDTVLNGENIYAGNSPVAELWSDGFDGSNSIANSDTPIDLTTGTATVYAKHSGRYYQITIKEDMPITDFKVEEGSVTDTTATFTWTAATDATSVKIMQSPKGENVWTDAAIQGGGLNPTSTTAIVTGLKPLKEYDFKLVVVGGSNQGDSDVVTVTTLDESDDQKDLNAEAAKYADKAEIANTVEAGTDVTATVVKLLDDQTPDSGIAISYEVSSGGTYLEISDGAIKLKARKTTEGDATGIVTITFTKNGESATREVTVTIKSSNIKTMKIGGTDYDLNDAANLPAGLSWDDGTKSLTMNGYYGGAIIMPTSMAFTISKIKVQGKNTINVDDKITTDKVVGLQILNTFTIEGSGDDAELNINVKSENVGIGGNNGTIGIATSNSSITLGSNVTVSIYVEADKGLAGIGIEGYSLTLNGGTLNISVKNAGGYAYGIDVPNITYRSGAIKISDDREIFAGSSSDYSPSFSRETPHIKNSKARKITDLTWDSGKDGTEGKAVEFTVYLVSGVESLSVGNVTVLLGALEVYEGSFENTKLGDDANITFDEGGRATIYVKTTRTVGTATTTRYFKINLVK